MPQVGQACWVLPPPPVQLKPESKRTQGAGDGRQTTWAAAAEIRCGFAILQKAKMIERMIEAQLNEMTTEWLEKAL